MCKTKNGSDKKGSFQMTWFTLHLRYDQCRPSIPIRDLVWLLVSKTDIGSCGKSTREPDGQNKYRFTFNILSIQQHSDLTTLLVRYLNQVVLYYLLLTMCLGYLSVRMFHRSILMQPSLYVLLHIVAAGLIGHCWCCP